MIRRILRRSYLAGLTTLLVLAAPAAGNSPPQVSNVNAVAFQDNSGKVAITFDLGDPDGDLITVDLYLCREGQPDPILHCQNTDPLPGSLFNPGAGRIIIWDAGIDYPGHAGGDYYIRVAASDDHAVMCRDYADALHWVGRTDMDQEGNDVCLSGNLALVTALYHGLEIYDIADPNDPQMVGEYLTTYGARCVAASPGYAFIVVPQSGIQVLDISTPSSPVLVHTLTEYAGSDDLLVEDGLLFTCAQYGEGLAIIDVTTPTSPTHLSTIDAYICSRFAVRGNLVYLAISAIRGGSGNMTIVDISDPEDPQERGSCIVEHSFDDIALTESGRHAMLLGDSWPYSFIDIMDVQDPDAPVYVDQYDLFFESTELEISGSRMFILDSECGGLYGYDLTVPTAPVQESAVFKFCGGTGFDLESGLAAIIDASGLGLLEVGSGRAARYISGFIYGSCTDVAISGDVAYLANQGYGPLPLYGLYTADISDPEHPSVLGEITSVTGITGLDVHGARAYLAGESALSIVDVSAPSAPTTVSTFPTSTSPQDVLVVGERAYVACSSALDIIDISDETAPVLMSATYGGHGTRIDHYGDHVYVGRRNLPVRIVNVADPADPHLVGLVDISSSDDVLIRGALLYALEYLEQYASRLHVVDVSNGASPAILGSCNIPGVATGLAREGDILYVTSSQFGLFVCDVSNPANPILLGAYNPMNAPYVSSNSFTAVALGDAAACIVGAEGLFMLARKHCPGRPDLKQLPSPLRIQDLELWQGR